MAINHWIVEFIIVSVMLLAFYVYKNRKIYALSWQLPGPTAWPIFGNAFLFYCKNEDLFDRMVSTISKYPRPLRFWFGPKFAFVITDVVQAEKIMSSIKFIRKDKVYKFIGEFNGEGLITGSGPKWKRDRRLMSPLFLKKNVVPFFPNILNHVKASIKHLEKKVDQPTFNIEDFIHKCATDFVTETITGINPPKDDLETFTNTVTRMYALVHARIVKVWLQVEWIFKFTEYKKIQEDGKQIIHGFLRKAINVKQGTNESMARNDDSILSFLDQMLAIKNNVPDFATDEQLVHHMTTIFSASEDTVTVMASFTFVLLGMYPSVQDKVVEEIFRIIGERDIEETDIDKLVYLDMVIKDVLRLFPIAPFIAREASQDFQLDKWLIPKGCTVIVSIHNIHRDAKLWEKPNEFYPEHFLPDAVTKRHPYAFLPFSAGPRGCLGKPFAYMAMKIIIVTILQNYIVESDGKLEDIRLKTDISVRSKDGMYPVRIKKRPENNC